MAFSLSFDIGIKNLAYCLMKGPKIVAWENINLEEAIVIPLCKVCNKKARFDDENGTTYCKRHVPKPILVEDKLPSMTELKKIVAVANTATKPANKAEWISFLKKHYCLPIVKEKIKKKTFHELFVLIKQFVESRWEFFSKATIVYLENQPTLKNPRMKSIQVILYTLLREKAEQDGSKATYCLVNPKKAKNMSYSERKKLTEKLALEYIKKTNKKWVDFFEGAKKKSDLADSLLLNYNFGNV
jgi:hypothetical protein